MTIEYTQCTEEEAKAIAARNNAVYRPEDLPLYKYPRRGSVSELKALTPFIRIPSHDAAI